MTTSDRAQGKGKAIPGVREPRGLTREGADTWGCPEARRRRQASRETCKVKQGRHWAMSTADLAFGREIGMQAVKRLLVVEPVNLVHPG